MTATLWPFILGSAALGLDAYVIAGLIPAITKSLDSTESLVGLGVAVFTAAYAIVGPLLAGAAGKRSRRGLIIALLIFTAANLATAVSGSITMFLLTRAVAGAAAGVYSPLASAAAAHIVEADQRGRALALVLSGLALGTVLGVPIGLTFASHLGWRATMVLITAVGTIALLGIITRKTDLPSIPATPPAERLRALARRANLLTVTVTFLIGIASIGLYTYLAVVLATTALKPHTTAAIWVWGLGGAIGTFGIGRLVDRGNPFHLNIAALMGLTLALAGVTSGSPIILLISVFVWGLCAWGYLTPQQHILLSSNPSDGATAVAANASANYLGGSVGALLGSLLLTLPTGASALPWSAAAVAAVATLGQIMRTRMER